MFKDVECCGNISYFKLYLTIDLWQFFPFEVQMVKDQESTIDVKEMQLVLY